MDRGAEHPSDLSGEASPDPWLPPRPKRRDTKPAIGILLMVLFVATVVGWFVVRDDLQGLVTALALATAITLTAAIALPRWPEKLLSILLLGFIATATVLLFNSATAQVYGVIALSVAFAIAPAFVVTVFVHLVAWARDQPPPPFPAWWRVLLYLASGAMLAATCLGTAGGEARLNGSQAVNHGRPVTVTPGDQCRKSTDSSSVTKTECYQARWILEGVTYRGTVHIGPGEVRWRFDPRLGKEVVTDQSIQAYTVPGDRNAYTPGFADLAFDGFDPFYIVPWWFLLGLPLLIVVMIGAAVVRKLRRQPNRTSG